MSSKWNWISLSFQEKPIMFVFVNVNTVLFRKVLSFLIQKSFVYTKYRWFLCKNMLFSLKNSKKPTRKQNQFFFNQLFISINHSPHSMLLYVNDSSWCTRHSLYSLFHKINVICDLKLLPAKQFEIFTQILFTVPYKKITITRI